MRNESRVRTATALAAIMALIALVTTGCKDNDGASHPILGCGAFDSVCEDQFDLCMTRTDTSRCDQQRLDCLSRGCDDPERPGKH